ncbi:MAG TPA: sugar ABC transporter ATP-binding protein [Verrucomicrobiota bacterium]|nr:sugar ABC transporter ATP-binding protein [Verrucomicrobiota bacterium]HNT15665.1 sugar ABC transporter ATP-binding protein [Verrucomicrobiota bacterium]
MRGPPLLSLHHITKRFPGVLALDAVSLQVNVGEVVALCGENGAGKSTLMKIVGGIFPPDAGVIQIAGATVRIPNAHTALRLGVAFIHQELNVLDNLDVAANVFFGREPRNPLGLVRNRQLYAAAAPLLQRLGVRFCGRTRVSELSLAERQMVEIARALSLEAKLIIMDEPTASLTLAETNRLLALARELQQQGVSVIYISHRLSEVERVADRVVVLRDGRNAGELVGTSRGHDAIVNLMVGRKIRNAYQPPSHERAANFFQVRNARSRRFPEQTVDFSAGRGEILGFAGLVGAGRSEIMKAIVGLDEQGTAELRLAGQDIEVHCPADALRHGVCLVPEDRRAEGLVVDLSVRENLTLPSLQRYATGGIIHRSRERTAVAAQIQSLHIRTPDAETPVGDLSGGNQQKVVLGKWLAQSPRVLILDEPTRGIDVGAKAEIYRLMRQLAGQGTVVLMVSSDMEELLNLSDRIVVMHEGRITGSLNRAECTEANVMRLAVGRTPTSSCVT